MTTGSDPRDCVLPEADDWYRRVFERAPIALFEENFTAVRDWIERQRAAGVSDIRRHLESNVEAMWEAVRLIEIVDANPEAVALLGAASREELLGVPTEPIVTEGSLRWFLEEIVALAEDRASLRFDVSGRTVSGEERAFTVMWVVGPSGGSGDLRVVVAVLDATAQRQREEELAALVESKDGFIAAVSHELRTPLTSIVGFARELRDRWAMFSDPERRELVTLIASQAGEMSELVDDLLVAARLAGDRVPVDPQDVDLAEITRSVLRSRPRPCAEQVSVSIERTLAVADPDHVRRIIRNLLSNAGEYGGGRVQISTGFTKDTVELLVIDDGPGLPPGDVEDAFGRYVTLGERFATPDTIGLGLSISRGLAELMEGSLAYSRHEGWTEFRLVLPRAADRGRDSRG